MINERHLSFCREARRPEVLRVAAAVVSQLRGLHQGGGDGGRREQHRHQRDGPAGRHGLPSLPREEPR